MTTALLSLAGVVVFSAVYFAVAALVLQVVEVVFSSICKTFARARGAR